MLYSPDVQADIYRQDRQNPGKAGVLSLPEQQYFLRYLALKCSRWLGVDRRAVSWARPGRRLEEGAASGADCLALAQFLKYFHVRPAGAQS